MKILHITNAYPTKEHPIYGIFIKEQIESLSKDKYKNHIFFINAKDRGKFEYLKAFFKLLFKYKYYNIIHCHHVFTAVMVLLVRPKVKVVVSFLSDGVHEFNFKGKIPFASHLYKLILKRSDARIFKKSIPVILKEDTYSFYLPNGVNTNLFKPMNKEQVKKKLGLNVNKKYILFVSSNSLYRKEKRYDLFKDVIQILNQKYNMMDIDQLLLINKSREKTPFYFNAANLHLLTSDIEGSPNSVKESLSCNIPVVSTNVGNVPDILKDVPNCYVAKSNSPEELADLVYKSLTYEGTYDLRGYIYSKKLDMHSISEKLEYIYQKVASKIDL